MLDPAARRRAIDLTNRVWVNVEPSPPRGLMSQLEQALVDQVTLNLVYTDAQERHTRREVEPMIFALNRDRWWLAAQGDAAAGGRGQVVRRFHNDRVRSSRDFGYWYMTDQALEAQALWRGFTDRDFTPSLEGVFEPHLLDLAGSGLIETPTQHLGASFLTAIGGHLAEITLPRPPGASDGTALSAPQFSIIQEWIELNESDGRKKRWGYLTGSYGGQHDSGARVASFRVAVDTRDSNPHEAAVQVQQAIDGWWQLFKSWFELFSSKDLEGLDVFHWSEGTLHLFSKAAQGGLSSHLKQSKMRRTVRPDMGFFPDGAIASAAHAAGCGHSVPLEWFLLREALRAFQRGQYRRSVIEAGTAAEVALYHLVVKELGKDAGSEEPTLGRLVNLEQSAKGHTSVLHPDFRQSVVELRNDAVHRAQDPGENGSAVAFVMVSDLLEYVSPREYLTEPYGVETRPGPSET